MPSIRRRVMMFSDMLRADRERAGVTVETGVISTS
jgi:hypothetical protein